MENEIEKLGNVGYAVVKGKIISGMIVSVRKKIRLNTGDDRHGRTLPATIQYQVRDEISGDTWIHSENIVFDKSNIHELIEN